MARPPHDRPAQATQVLADAIAAYEAAHPEPREAAADVVLKRLRSAAIAFAAIAHQFKPARARTSHPLALWHVSLMDVLVRAERHRQKAPERKRAEETAQLVINTALGALKRQVRPFMALLAREAEVEVFDYDLDAFGGGYAEADAAYAKLLEILLDRRGWGRNKLRHLRLTQKQEKANPNYTVLAGLRDLVGSLIDCAPKAGLQRIANLATAIFGVKISEAQVKAARRYVRKNDGVPGDPESGWGKV